MKLSLAINRTSLLVNPTNDAAISNYTDALTTAKTLNLPTNPFKLLNKRQNFLAGLQKVFLLRLTVLAKLRVSVPF